IARLITTIHAERAEPAEQKAHSPRPQRMPRGKGASAPPWAWLALGISMGALSLTRENALVFIVVIGAWALLSNAGVAQGFSPARTRIGAAASFALGLAIILVPVATRNSLVGGGFYVTTSQFGPNFYIGNNRNADGTYASLRYGRGAPEY